MKLVLIALLVFLSVSGCSRNGEYTYISELSLIDPAETLLLKITERLRTSPFRKNYDQTLVDRIGSSFRNFKHIRAYQAVLEDALVYLMIQTETTTMGDDLRNALIHPVSKLILSGKSSDELIEGLDKITQMLKEKEGAALTDALAAYDTDLAAQETR